MEPNPNNTTCHVVGWHVIPRLRNKRLAIMADWAALEAVFQTIFEAEARNFQPCFQRTGRLHNSK
jgi:hypothetical protein